jgi:hypothetical protein
VGNIEDAALKGWLYMACSYGSSIGRAPDLVRKDLGDGFASFWNTGDVVFPKEGS